MMNIMGRRFVAVLHEVVRNPGFTCLHRDYTLFKSALALENLYPTSNVKLYTPNFIAENADEKFNGFIPVNKLTITYSRSSGPGGQHVNTVNTKVDLRFEVKSAQWITEEIREKLLIQERNRINKEGFLVIKSDLTRSQQLNLADAMERLRVMIRKTLKEAPEVTLATAERIRKGKINAARQRLFEKRKRSQIKQDRRMDDLS